MAVDAEPVAPPLPSPSPESLPFWESCRNRELRTQRCRRCQRFWFPPSLLCQHCWSREWSWERLSGRGSLVSYVVYRRVYHPAFRNRLPYVVGVIGLAEGVRFLTRLTEVKPEEVYCGLEVEVVFEAVVDGVVLPLFRPLRKRGEKP